jgi:hypothetical protein
VSSSSSSSKRRRVDNVDDDASSGSGGHGEQPRHLPAHSPSACLTCACPRVPPTHVQLLYNFSADPQLQLTKTHTATADPHIHIRTST